jgi:DNA modification methylase
MVRALLNVYAPGAKAFVLDPYVGSGTALTEAWAMGMPSAGVDIDPLSALIANAKIHLLQADEVMLEGALDVKARLNTLRTGQLPLFPIREEQASYTTVIPSFLTRRIPVETQEEIADDIGMALSAMDWLDDGVSLPFRVALSDAISRKFKFRFLGLGYGRFSLNIRPGRIVEMFSGNLDYLAKSVAVWQWLRKAANLQPVPSGVQLGDARSLPYHDGAFDFVVTSPPYMPASSGRENYLKSKALAMTALGLIRADEVDAYEQRQVGSVHRSDGIDHLPLKARETVEWMASDEVRRVKAAATASYFADLAQSLREIRRVLRSGGCCALVIARQHTFYRYKSRDVVRVIDNAEIVSELAERSGLEIENALHVELNKQNAVARPRSLDAYYETVLILKRP